MNTTELVVEMRPVKNSSPYGIWTSHISSHCSPLGRFIWIQHYNQLPVGSLAQLVERCNRHRRGHGFMGWKDICRLLVVALGNWNWIQHYNQLPVGSLAQLVERCNRHRRGHGFMGWKDICRLLVVALGNWKLGNVWPKSISVLWNVWIEAQVFLD